MPRITSVNIGAPQQSSATHVGVTGIDKQPADSAVDVVDPGPKGSGGSGLAGDAVCDQRHHGGSDQAVYAYSAEDLEEWAARLGRQLPPGSFGENLTTRGIDVTGARIGERWRIGERLLLEVSTPRIPCRTFAAWLGERGWVKAFTDAAKPGAYLRVIEPGAIRTGDQLNVVHIPEHTVTIGLAFRALTTERDLLPQLLAADALPAEKRRRALDAAS